MPAARSECQLRPARPLLLESATVARHIELAAMELLSAWGLAVFELARSQAAGITRCRTILERWSQTEERHYVISPLRWATTVFAESGEYRDVKACTAALTQVAAQTGQVEAMSALAHALGENALIAGDPEEAASQFERASSLFRRLTDKIVDLSPANDSRFLDAVGESGHFLSSPYDDFLKDWRAVVHRKMRMDRADIDRGALGHLRLVP